MDAESPSIGAESHRGEKGRVDDDEGIVSQLSVRCDRRHPCSHCVKTDAACNYPAKQKPKERRQRVFISELYERKIDFIAKKLEEFGKVLGHMENSPQISIACTRPSPNDGTPSFLEESPEAHSAAAGLQRKKVNILTPKVEYEGESSLSAQAAFANRFLQQAVSNRHSTDITGEMASVLGALSRTLGGQKDRNDTEYLYTNARTMEPGCSVRDLPMPPVDLVFLQLIQLAEHPRVRFFWNHDATTVAPFTEFFLKVYSPGDATHADLIIINAGLYWLFLECMNATQNTDTKSHYKAQAFTCRDNLETVLSSLPFHLPSTIETTCAMCLAALYCLEICQPSAAWNFIATASHMVQTLGCHSIVAMARESPETKNGKMKLFWLIYVIEKGLSLRLGRSSTIRDSDVTVPRPKINIWMDPEMACLFPRSTDFAMLQGLVYDQIYSPAALIQPQENRYTEKLAEAIGKQLYEAIVRTDKVNQLSLACLIYRAIPPEAGEKTVFGKACIATARQALEEHQRCMASVAGLEEYFLEFYVNWALLVSPFVPFIVMFCHVIETCDEKDLDLLAGLVATLRSTTAETFSYAIKKELRLFNVLYDVACSYMKLKSESSHKQPLIGGPGEDWGISAGFMQQSQVQSAALAQETSNLDEMTSVPQDPTAFTDISLGGHETDSEWASFTLPGDLAMEVDEQGSHLGNWLYMNNQMIRALENNFF
ncbi:fungal specific transcription factor [Colletotrichum tofieldiae]|uniref:Fungal specific transcription factor n=1 Tax=Colletotrichum tofieldiae TaxID=708197 RepID=A0A166WQT8_9PEZI|nr:fungal specific transcription factor [Colletotrichum tofieldiae]